MDTLVSDIFPVRRDIDDQVDAALDSPFFQVINC